MNHDSEENPRPPVSPHPLFDPQWYQQQEPSLPTTLATIEHYLEAGWRLSRSPHPLFSPDFYLSQRQDVRDAGIEPLSHFIQKGWKERTNPHPLFDVTYYLAQQADLEGLDPLSHYCLIGWRKGLKPCKLFDPAWYRTYYPDVEIAGIDPLRHFVEYGRLEGRHASDAALNRKTSDSRQTAADRKGEHGGGASRPAPGFDPQWYLAAYADVRHGIIDPWTHYDEIGRFQGRHAAFDEAWYIAEYPDVVASGLKPYQHYLIRGRTEGRHPAFSREWYRQEYPDVSLAGIDPLEHYNNHGRYECRNPAFDRDWYLTEYPDVRAGTVDAYDHYVRHGRKEGRHPAFNRYWYKSEYRDVADSGADPCTHYASNGKGEGRHPGFARHWYVAEYPEVVGSGIDPYRHYTDFGKDQGKRPALHFPTQVIHYARSSHFPKSYDSEYAPEQDFSGFQTDIKAIAFYLPQFHQTMQNDRWWGEGFTEWTNTQRALPRFPGHYQPREPHKDIGYYDLADPEVLRIQAALARRHGIHGFCFYHYWFSGERVLEKPVDLLLEHPDIEINFCLCWANENWTRTWDGLNNDVLMAQQYSDADPHRFINDIAKYLDDPRYIRIDGRPLIMVYKP